VTETDRSHVGRSILTVLLATIHAIQVSNTGCLQLLEISWNFIYAPGKFNCQLKYGSMPITEPNLVMSLNPRNCHFTIFCAVLFI